MCKANCLHVTAGAVALLALFVYLASPLLSAAVLLAAVCHELGHYLTLRALGADVNRVRISALGAEMEVAGSDHLSYGNEMMAFFAGPLINLILAFLLGYAGRWWAVLYPMAGAQLVLGIFNLLPVRPLDGGNILWIITAWISEPFTADQITKIAGFLTAGALLALGCWLTFWQGGSPFLLLAAIGLIAGNLRKYACKRKENRVK